jgi:hypothetical protein
LCDVRLEDIPLFKGDLQAALQRTLDQEILHSDLVAACKSIASSSEGARNTTFNNHVFALAIGRVDLHEKTVNKWVTEAARHAGLSDSEIASTFESAAKGAERKSRATAVKPALSFTLFRDIDPLPARIGSCMTSLARARFPVGLASPERVSPPSPLIWRVT